MSTLARKLFFEVDYFLSVLDLRNSRINCRTETSAFQILEVFAVLNYPSSKTFRDLWHPRRVRTKSTPSESLDIRSEFNYVQHRGTVCSKTQFSCRGKSKHVNITAPSPETLRLVESLMVVPGGHSASPIFVNLLRRLANAR